MKRISKASKTAMGGMIGSLKEKYFQTIDEVRFSGYMSAKTGREV